MCNSLLNNPIYDGPVYDSIHPQFENINTHRLQEDTQDTNFNTVDDSTQNQNSDNMFAPSSLELDVHSSRKEKNVFYHDQPSCSLCDSLNSLNSGCRTVASSIVTGFVNPAIQSEEYIEMQAHTALREYH